MREALGTVAAHVAPPAVEMPAAARLHVDGQARCAQADELLLHATLEQQVEGSRHVPLVFRRGAKAHAQDRTAVLKAVDALHFQWRPDAETDERILAQL